MCSDYPSYMWEAVARWYPSDPYCSVASSHGRALAYWLATRDCMSASPVRAARFVQGLEDLSFDPFGSVDEGALGDDDGTLADARW